jgi:hypothetical protein
MEPRVKTCLFLEDAEAEEAFTSVKVLADQRTNVVKLVVDVIELSVIDLVGNPGVSILSTSSTYWDAILSQYVDAQLTSVLKNA